MDISVSWCINLPATRSLRFTSGCLTNSVLPIYIHTDTSCSTIRDELASQLTVAVVRLCIWALRHCTSSILELLLTVKPLVGLRKLPIGVMHRLGSWAWQDNNSQRGTWSSQCRCFVTSQQMASPAVLPFLKIYLEDVALPISGILFVTPHLCQPLASLSKYTPVQTQVATTCCVYVTHIFLPIPVREP